MDNSPIELTNNIRDNIDDYFDENTDLIVAIEEIEYIILGVGLGILLLLALFSFRPAVNALFNEFELATAAIMSIPKEAVEANNGKLKEVMNVKEKKKKDKDRKKFGLSALPENGEEEDDSDSDDDMIDTLEARDDLHSRTQLYFVLTGQYCTTLFLVSAIYIVVMVTLNLLSVKMQQANIRTKLASDLQILTWRIGYICKMMSWNDVLSYENVKSLRKYIEGDHTEFLDVKDAFMFGSDKYRLDYSFLPDNIRDEVFGHEYLNDEYFFISFLQ